MKGQHPGITQPLPRQQSGYDDMQLLQQQLMYRQLEELQRQQQIQIGQEQKQHNSLNHISMWARQVPANQLPTLINGVPLNDTSNCSWQNEFTGSDPKASGNSQMTLVGNLNMAQHGGTPGMRGLMVSHDQGQVLRSMGLVSQQSDQFSGMPTSNTRTNQYSSFLGMPQDFPDIMTKAEVNQMQKPSVESASYNHFQSNQNLYGNQSCLQSGILSSKQDMQGKKMFGHATGESVNNIGGIFQQMNTIGRAPEGQELNIRHDHSNWSGTLQEKELQQSGTSQVSVGLDPTEQKILFSSDDDVSWDPSFGKSIIGMGNMQGNHLEGGALLNSFPSFQSGSWSALMQSAVAEVSSGDAGMQDEWSGSTFQKVESSSGSHTATINDTVKQQSSLFHNNLLSSSSLSSRSGPFENGEQSSNVLHSEKTHIGHQNIEGPWNLQQNMSLYTLNNRSQDKGNGWNINGSHSSNFEASYKIHGDEGSTQHDFTNDSMRTVHTDRDHSVNMWNSDVSQVVASSSVVGLESSKSGVCLPQMHTSASMNSNSSKGNYETNRQGFYQHEFDYGKHVLDSSQGNENMRNSQQKLNHSPQIWESPVRNSDKVTGEIYNKTKEHGPQREISNDSYISNQSHPDHSSDSVGIARDNFPLPGTNDRSFSSGIQQIHGQIGHDMLAQRFHYGPIGNSVSEHEMGGSQMHVVHSQGIAQMVDRGFKSPEERSLQQNVTSSPLDTKMKHLDHLQTNAKKASGMHPEYNNGLEYKLSASFEESATMLPPSSQPRQTGQNMLELLHKVDQSREDDNDNTQSSFSDQDASCQRNESIISEGTVNDLNPMHHDTETDDRTKRWSSPAAPVQMHNWDMHKFLPRQPAKETSGSNMQTDNSMAGKACDLSYVGNQLQQQTDGHTTGHSANMSLRGQYDRDTNNVHSSLQQKNGTNDGSIATSQSSFLGMSGRNSFYMLASSLASPSAVHPTVLSQSYHVKNHGQSQPMPADSSIKRNSSKQLHAEDTGQVPKPSPTSGMPQHGGISVPPQNVWTNISAERLSNGVSQKTTPVAIQSTNSVKLDASSWSSQKSNSQDQRNGESIPPNFGSFACNPPNLNYGKEYSAKVGLKQQVALAGADSTSENTSRQESAPNQSSGSTSVFPNTSSVHLHEKGKHGKSSSDKRSLQIDRSAEMNASPYSLLHQVQAMKAFEADPNNRASKRLKGSESVLDSQQLAGKPLRYYDSNIVGKGQGDDLSAIVHHGSFPPDSKMLSFSSDGSEQQNATKSKVVGKETNQELGSSLHSVSQNYPRSIVTAPINFPSGGNTDHQHAKINPQMAPSWFEQYGNLRKSNAPAIFNRHSGNSQNSAKIIAEQYSMPQAPDSMSTQYVPERKNDATAVLSNQLASLQESSSGVSEHDVNRSKKRKTTSDLLPWHREVMVGSDRLQNIRMAERDWAQVTNRLVEKVQKQADFSDDIRVMPRTRRRLILTTQLMQQLLPSMPATMLSKPASIAYENITYLVARLSLGDACGLISCLRTDTCGHSDGENRISGKSKSSDRSRDQFFLELMENFVGRARKLETDLNRSVKRASILDIKVECQELEKFAIINRFAKYHVRNQLDGESSNSETIRSTLVHRHVTTAHSLSTNVPEGVLCLSL